MAMKPQGWARVILEGRGLYGTQVTKLWDIKLHGDPLHEVTETLLNSTRYCYFWHTPVIRAQLSGIKWPNTWVVLPAAAHPMHFCHRPAPWSAGVSAAWAGIHPAQTSYRVTVPCCQWDTWELPTFFSGKVWSKSSSANHWKKGLP